MEGWGGGVDNVETVDGVIHNVTVSDSSYYPSSDALIPLKEGDEVVSACRHASKIAIITKQGRFYRIDPFDASVKEVVRGG